MASFRMINCHVHTFTTAHSPKYYPARAVYLFRLFPWLVQVLRWLVGLVRGGALYDWLVRMENFHRTGGRTSQTEVFKEVVRYYPRDTKFVVLPMDMALIGHGPVEEDIEAQHDGLAKLARDPVYGGQVIPFATVFPDRPGAFKELRRCVEDHGFRGVKLYPKLGFHPNHPVLRDEVYPFCLEHNLPIITHCSRGGVRGKAISQAMADEYTSPEAYLPVMAKYPDLRICLAHFGGDTDWRTYLCDGIDPHDLNARKENWVTLISDMIECGDYPNLYTDISYTIFNFDDYAPLLSLLLEKSQLAERVLFGSDFYMTRQEALSERAVSIRLRKVLGEEMFAKLATHNPERWLGYVP